MPHARCLFIVNNISSISRLEKAEMWGESVCLWFAFLVCFMLMNSYLKKKSGCIWNLLYHLIPELTNIRNISSIPVWIKNDILSLIRVTSCTRRVRLVILRGRGLPPPQEKKMLIRVFDGTFFPGHPEINVTWVSPKIIHQKQAMSQVISLMELEDEFLEAMD